MAALGLRRARRDEQTDVVVEPIVPATASVLPRAARLTLGFRPARAGLNMLSATVEGELIVANEGDAPATGIRVRTALLSAHGEQDAAIAAFAAEPIGRPAVAPFALMPGERRAVRVVAAAPRDALRTMTAAGRPMFVPVVVVNLVDDAGQVAQAFAIGIERVDSAKLAPFWLDAPARSYDQVAARPHGARVASRRDG